MKIYGYKNQDVIGLINYLNESGDMPLSRVFAGYASESGKSKGTVRNLYYALAKRASSDAEFCDKFLGGRVLKVSKLEKFRDCEERALIRKILTETSKGRSVRSVITAISGGDEATALRYQNKYRNLVKKNPELIKEISNELGLPFIKKEQGVYCDLGLRRLKKEIDGLVSRISAETEKENKALKKEILILRAENERLRKINSQSGIKGYFIASKGESKIAE